MTIYFSQNFEDVYLSRCFCDVADGKYVDIGAGHPIEDSVTYMLYMKGWDGINIEPQLDYYRLLKEKRPRDKTYNVAIGNDEGEPQILYTSSSAVGLAGLNEGARLNIIESGLTLKTTMVQQKRMDSIIRDSDIGYIDFLKVDVEGAELDVLNSFSFTPKPRLICIEVTYANSNIKRDENTHIERLLRDRGYRLIFFDGLNDWWEDSRENFSECFMLPPNVVDGISPSSIYAHVELARIAQFNEQLIRVEQNRLTRKYGELKIEKNQLAALLEEIQKSISWRFFKPIVYVEKKVKRLLEKTRHR